MEEFKINSYDIETYSEDGKVTPYCVCCIIEGQVFSFYEHDVVYQSLVKISTVMLKQKALIYVHNLNFDGCLILEVIVKKKLSFVPFFRKTSIYKITLYLNGKILIFKCSHKFLPLPLEKIGLELNYEKGVFPHKFMCKKTLNYIGPIPNIEYYNVSEEVYIKLLTSNPVIDLKLTAIQYCLRDVEIVSKVISRLTGFIKEVVGSKNISVFESSTSVPAMARKIFFLKFNQANIRENIPYKEYEGISNSVYGGRNEVLSNPYKGWFINSFDFSGMYATMMKEKFPVGKSKLEDMKDFTKAGFYWIEYHSNCYLPALPYRPYNGSKLLFPNGNLYGGYPHEEIINAINLSKIKILKIHHAVTYESTDYVYSEYIHTFEKIRKLGGMYKFFAKLEMNALFGSSLMRNDEVFTFITGSEDEVEMIRINFNVVNIIKMNQTFLLYIKHDYKSKNCFNQGSLKDKYPNVGLGATITGKARARLLKGAVEIEKNGGRLHYMDTDSYFASFKESKLGQTMGEITWSDQYEDAFFVSGKFYGYIEDGVKIVKCKGISRKDLSYDKIKSNFYSNEASFEVEDNLQFYRKEFNLTQHLLTKKLSLHAYDKRIFNSLKDETIPLWITHL